MSKYLENLKKKGLEAINVNRAARISGKIIPIERGIKSIGCKFHTDPNGKPMKVIVALNPRMKDFQCSCGTIYKYIN